MIGDKARTLLWGLTKSDASLQCQATPACKSSPFIHDMRKPNDLDRKANASIVVVSEAPGKLESNVGRPLVEDKITSALRSARLNRNDVYMTHVVKCRATERNKTGRVQPRRLRSPEINQCLPLLEAEIKVINPDAIIAMGEMAIRSLTGESSVSRAMEAGMLDYNGIPVIPIHHPGATTHVDDVNRIFEMREEREIAFKKAARMLAEKRGILQV